MKKIFKIAMVAACPFPYPRGTPVRIFRMAEALTQRGHEVHVITYHLGNELNGALFKVHRIKDIITYQKHSPGPTYQKLIVVDPLLAVKLYKFLKQNEVDIIHAHNFEGLLVASLVKRFKKLPIIYDAHTILESELPYYNLGFSKKIVKRIGSYLDRRLPRMANYIITVTDIIRTKLIQNSGIDSKNITTLMNGIEREHFNIKKDDCEIHKNGRKTLIFTGNTAAYQRIDLLLKVLREILNKRQDIQLLIISDSPFNYYESLANKLQVRSYVNVISSEFNSLPKYLAEADISLNPRTDCDGIPQKLLNYMAAGRAVVSFSGSGKILEHGKTGWIVENGNVNAFANAVLFLLDNPIIAQKLGDNAREFITLKHTWEKVAEGAEDIYERVLRENHSSASSPIFVPNS